MKLWISVTLALALALAWPVAAAPAAADPPAPWFDRLIGTRPLSPAAELELARYVAGRLLEISPRPKLPRILKSDRRPRMVFASLSDGHGPAIVLHGSGEGASDAVDRLVGLWQAKRQQAEKRPEEMPESVQWLKIDLVRDVVRDTGVDPNQPLDLPRDLYGLGFDARIGAAFLPGELVARTLVDSDQLLRLKNLAAHLEEVSQAEDLGRAAVSKSMAVYRFSTAAFFSDATVPPGNDRQIEIVPLYRGNRHFEAPSPESLLEAAREAGDYLARAVGTDGRFVYSYRPKTDQERSKYNILRHAGTIYSMIELYQVTGDEELLATAERAVAFLGRAIEHCPTGAEFGGSAQAACVIEKGFVKLGGNALGIIALAKHAEVTDSDVLLPVIDRLGLWLLATQNDAGEFIAHKVDQKTGELDDHVSQYYPGEAVLALLRLSRLHGSRSRATAKNDRWLDAAEKGARWLIETRDRDVSDHRLNHDHWLLYALNELHRRRPDPLYLKHAERITGAILRLQNRRPPYPDWLGTYYNPPRSTPTATRSEGLAAAYLLARDFGRQEPAARLLEGLKLGVRFQLKTQFRPESVLYLPDPRRTLGGFRRGLDNYEIRIDYVQHNISALLLLRRILLEQTAGPS